MAFNDFILARSYLYSLEDVVDIKKANIDIGQVIKVVDKCAPLMGVYQEYKGAQNNRRMLPLVSSKTHDSNGYLYGTGLHELDFRDDTEYLDMMPSLKDFIHRFDYGRSHIISMGAGGFFPPHRDGPIPPHFEQECFRVLVTIDGCTENDLCFVTGGKVAPLRNGRAYYINTFKTHHAFSFNDKCKFAILNFQINLRNIETLQRLGVA
jgi:hypothetical protein